VGTFAAGIAHELGTQLAVIAGRAALIADGTVSGDAVPKCAESIVNQSAKVTKIIRGLLDFARRRSATMAPKNLAELVGETLALLEPMARKSNVDFDFRRTGEAISLNVDSVQLQQVITNLVVNAIDAMPSGGKVVVEVGMRMATPPMEHGGHPDLYAVLDVSDEGAGIRSEHMDQIFEPFFTTKPVGQGTGLGLPVSYGIVAEHGGWIDVSSEVGTGSRFSIYLPSSAGAQDQRQPSRTDHERPHPVHRR
jgi:signal transduction histidine kinase